MCLALFLNLYNFTSVKKSGRLYVVKSIFRAGCDSRSAVIVREHSLNR